MVPKHGICHKSYLQTLFIDLVCLYADFTIKFLYKLISGLFSIWKAPHYNIVIDVTDNKVLYLGLIQSLFEGSMYVFVLEWTPALTPKPPVADVSAKRHLLEDNNGHRTIPHGHIFAAFMVSNHDCTQA